MITHHPFHLNGSGKTFQKLGFQATFLSIGAHRSETLNIPGERLRGVFHGVEFLRDIHLGKRVKIGNRVAVIGGGNVAIDVARSAIRLGAKSVRVYYRRSIKEMPAIPEEVEEAIQEGVRIHFLSSPVKIIERGGEAVGLECVRMRLTEPDQKGRKTPVPIKGSTYQAGADTILVAVGQRVDQKFIKGLDVNPDRTIRVDPKTCETSLKGVFAGGDMVTGPGWAIDAIAAGKKAAESISRYLS
jgi:NADPH-dependent glutamate synthase beta subunit-like oxidoreductase